jgi:hypothetical protein
MTKSTETFTPTQADVLEAYRYWRKNLASVGAYEAGREFDRWLHPEPFEDDFGDASIHRAMLAARERGDAINNSSRLTSPGAWTEADHEKWEQLRHAADRSE